MGRVGRRMDMKFYGGKEWGGILTVYPVKAKGGRLIIGVTNEKGKEYGISVSRWISERKAGP
jgi:hypothetical protein